MRVKLLFNETMGAFDGVHVSQSFIISSRALLYLFILVITNTEKKQCLMYSKIVNITALS